jgi:AcrR family transcriptional regulator
MLAENSFRDVSVVDIAKRANTSPATFYQYFKDVGEVTLYLAEEAVVSTPRVLELIDGTWEGDEGMNTARALAEAFVSYWDEHRYVLRVRNLLAEEGDRRFHKVRQDSLEPIVDRLARQCEQSQRSGRISKMMHAYTAAAASTSILESMSAYYGMLGARGVTRDTIVETCARMVYQTVTGRTAPDR